MFAGKSTIHPQLPRCTYLFLETNEAIKDSNRYQNLIFLEQLLHLATYMPADSRPVDIKQKDSFEALFEAHRSDEYYDKDTRYVTRIRDENTINRLRTYCDFLQELDSKDLLRFQNALQTYTWAREIEDLPNPHLKYTLFMTLYLSAINQLADNPRPKCPSHLVCPDCSESVNMKHQDGSHAEEMEKLLRRLFTGKNLDQGIKRMKRLYNNLRSDYLHDGLLSGEERRGGFLSDDGKQRTEILEDMFNTAMLVRQLLELFIQEKALSQSDDYGS